MPFEEINVQPGEEWIVVTCHNQSCGRTLLIEPITPEMLDENGVLTIHANGLIATCPHCKTESSYRMDEIRRDQAQQKH